MNEKQTNDNSDTEGLLFKADQNWENEWRQMPEYKVKALVPTRTIKINFLSDEDVTAFGELIGQKIHPAYENYWFPKLNLQTDTGKIFLDEP